MRAQLVVIGGGIIGLACAVTLQRRGVQVLLLDAGDPGMGASWGNAGHIATEQVHPVADAGMLLRLPAMLFDPLGPLRIDWRYLPRLLPWGWQALRHMLPASARRSHQALLAINAHSLAAWKDFAQRWQLLPWLRTQGSVLTCEKPETCAQLKRHGQTLNTLGVRNRWLEAGALREMVPALNDAQLGGLYYPDTAHISDLRAISRGLVRALQDLGGQVQAHRRVTHALTDGASGFRIITDTGEVAAEQVLLTAGAFSRQLAHALTGVSVPLETERGYHLMLPAETGRLPLPISSADRRFVMTPMDAGLRLAGTVEYAGLDLPPDMRRARNLLPLANGLVRVPLDARDAREWMGFRPTTADSLPVIDRVGKVMLAFGHHHLGLTQAASTAACIEALHLGQAPPFALEPFSLKRFARGGQKNDACSRS